jgi:tetratricopeptide (TPR) repeat protein
MTGNGSAFFDRADQVASTGNWDFAIEMYLEGIIREPDNMDRGHKPLREVSLKRKMQGGKKPGLGDTLKCRGGKDPVQTLRNAEYLLAKDPGNVGYMEQVLSAAVKLDLSELVKWIGQIILESQRLAKKADKRILMMVTKAFAGAREFSSAVTACKMALDISKDDNELMDMLRDLDAKSTIKAGQYDQEGSFTKGVKNKEKQRELMEKDKLVSSKSFQEEQIEKAQTDYLANPLVPAKILGYVDALLKIEDDATENMAIDVLTKAHKDTSAYLFKMRIGDIKIRQSKRKYTKLLAAGDKAGAIALAKKQLEIELVEFAERCANYPTDLALKYEMGRRLLKAGKHDEAISALQQASRDARRFVPSMLLLGQAFTQKGWLREAGETYERTLQTDMTEDKRKEILYCLGDVKERIGTENKSPEDLAKALDYFSQLAQIDFNFKDVRTRLEKVRNVAK